MDEQLKRQLEALDAKGRKERGTDEWDSVMQRLGQVSGGIPEDALRQVVQDPDATTNLYTVGRDARLRLLQQAQDCRTGNPALAAALDAEERAARQKEREDYARSKGRIR